MSCWIKSFGNISSILEEVELVVRVGREVVKVTIIGVVDKTRF